MGTTSRRLPCQKTSLSKTDNLHQPSTTAPSPSPSPSSSSITQPCHSVKKKKKVDSYELRVQDWGFRRQQRISMLTINSEEDQREGQSVNLGMDSSTGKQDMERGGCLAAWNILVVAGNIHELGAHWYTSWIKENMKYKTPDRMVSAPRDDIFDHLENLIKTQDIGKPAGGRYLDRQTLDSLVDLWVSIVSVSVLNAEHITPKVLGNPNKENIT
ncbi:hypothetical protein BJ878DRAFT_482792 [Calycina marina]|uniref:Uncharacterized protein n=1 Tax=Calycina marina TaxID=1763456 RepID=A0A9P7YX21_9HELO|nr:hypothetical protein BJ878DRAFT_482792 [Calycina marina]